MQLFTLHDLLVAAQFGIATFWEVKGIVADEALQLVLLPFYEFSLASCLVSLGWVVVFWKNKGLLLSGVSHMLDISGWFLRVLKLDNR